jgi:thiol-disulfide isomerase/thioredoxin
MKSAVLIIMLVAQSAIAGITDNQMNIKVTGNVIELKPNKGFHINDKAPASATYDNLEAIYKPKIKTEQKMTFHVLPKTKKANLKYFVCDDAKTVCEQHAKEVVINKDAEMASAAATLEPAQKTTNTEKFVSTEKPTLLIFSAPWCPACIRMATETYPEAAVKKLFSKMNVQKINIDLVENEAISKKYNVKAIPSLILVNTSGEEVFRWLDYQPAQKFAKELDSELKNKDDLVSTVRKADSGDKVAALKAAQIYSSQMSWEKAAQYYDMLKDERSKNLKLSCEVNLLSDTKDDDDKAKSEYLLGLDKSIALTTSTIDQLRWKIDYFETKETPKEKRDTVSLQKVIADLNKLLSDQKIAQEFQQSTIGDMTGFEKIETLDMRGRVEDLLGLSEAKKETQKQMLSTLLKQKHDVKFPGRMINSIYYFTQAGSPTDAEKLIQKLVAANPKSYVYYQRYASFLTGQKRAEEALVQIDKALQFKEGNEPQLNVAKIKILKNLAKKTEALALVEKTQELIKLAPEKYKRTKVTLESFQKELSKN